LETALSLTAALARTIGFSESGDLKPLVKSFIFIGTDNPSKTAFKDSMFKFVSETEAEATEKKFIARWAEYFSEKRYFCFNVEQGLQNT
jgi:hypothetical protein